MSELLSRLIELERKADLGVATVGRQLSAAECHLWAELRNNLPEILRALAVAQAAKEADRECRQFDGTIATPRTILLRAEMILAEATQKAAG